MRYILLDDLVGKKYLKFLKVAFANSDFFSVSTFKTVHKKDLEDSYFSFFEKIAPYQTSHTFKQLPQHYERGQRINVYKLTDETRNAVLTATDSLFKWRIPVLPEDLSFFRNNKVWFNSITHANIATVVNWDTTLLDQLSPFGLFLEQ